VLGQLMKSTVENYYRRASDSNPLFRNARLGRLKPENINAYLSNILYLIQHTPTHLSYAKAKAKERKMDDLAVFFGTKMHEEDGHDKWAESDLSEMNKKFGATPDKNLSPHIVHLVKYIKEIIDRDPSLYVSYIFLAEYFTVLIAPNWLEDLEKNCGIPRSMMSVIGNHAELDKEHVAEDLRQIELLLGHVKNAEPFLETLKTAITLHENFCSEVGRTR
jgi:hypothetical protein